MLSFLASLLTGPIVGAVMQVITKRFDVQMNRDVIQGEIEKEVLKAITHVASTQADVIKAEINSEERFVRLWRPIASMCLVSVLLFYSLISPIAVDWFGAPPVRVGDTLLGWIYTLCGACLGGYMAGRSLEKITEMIVSRWRK